MQAYKNDPAFKEELLREMKSHYDEDRIIRNSYGFGLDDKDYKGCAIGCAIHSLAMLRERVMFDPSDHKLLATELNIPVSLCHLIDLLFESLPSQQARQFPGRVLAAIRPGADLSPVAFSIQGVSSALPAMLNQQSAIEASENLITLLESM